MANLGALGSLFIDLSANTATFETDLGRAERLAERHAEKLKEVFRDAAKDIFKGFAAIEIGKSIVESLSSAIENADRLNKAVQKVGLSAQYLSGLKYAAQLADVSFEDLTAGVGKFNKNIVAARDGAIQQAGAFRALGITQKQLAESSPEQLLGLVANRFAETKDGADKTAVSMALFGKAGADLIPLLNEGQKGLAASADEAARFGLVLDSKATEAAEAFRDNLTKLDAAAAGVATRVAAELLPGMEGITHQFVELAKQKSTQDALVEFTHEAAIGIATLGEALVGVVKLAMAVGGSFEAVAADAKAAFAAAAVLFTAGQSDAVNAQLRQVLTDREKTLREANARYVDLIHYDGTAVSDALRESFRKQAQATTDAGASANEGGGSALHYSPLEDEKAHAAALKAAAASRTALEAAQAELSALQNEAAGHAEISKAVALRQKVEQGAYAALDAATKKALLGYADQIQAAETLVAANQKAVEAARKANDLYKQTAARNLPLRADANTILSAANSRRGDLYSSSGAGYDAQGAVHAQYGAAVAQEQAAFKQQLDALEQAHIEAQGLDQGYYKAVEDARQIHNQKLLALDEARAEASNRVAKDEAQQTVDTLERTLNATGSLLGALGSLQNDGSRKAFERQKAFAIAQATINTISGAIGAYTQAAATIPPPFGEVVGTIEAAAVTASGLAQIAQIKGQSYSGRRYGGAVAAGGVYEVAEPGNPELIRYGSKTLLAMGSQPGTVTPARVASVERARATSAAPVVHVQVNNSQASLVDAGARVLRASDGSLIVQLAVEEVKRQIGDNASPITGLLKQRGLQTAGRF